MGDNVVLVSSAEVTANEVFAKLKSDDLLNPSTKPPSHRFIASSDQEMFGELGRRFLGPEFGQVEHRPWPSHPDAQAAS
jgi:glutamate racemase